MNQRFSGQKLTLPDRYTGRKHIQTQGPVYRQQGIKPLYPAQYTQSPSFQPQSTPKRPKRRLFPLVVILLTVFAIFLSGGYYVLTTSNHGDAGTKNMLSSIITKQGIEPSSDRAVLNSIVQTRLDQFATDVDKIKRAGGDITPYQQKLEQDRSKASTVTSPKDVVALLIQISSDLTAVQGALTANNANTLLNNFQQEAQQWGNAHNYHDTYDGKDYSLASSYLNMDGHNGVRYGEGAYMSDEVNTGYPQAYQDLKDDYFLLSMMETNYEDTTPYSQPHQVDQALLNYFSDQHTYVLIVSLTEQAVRIYNDGNLVQAFQVTTGRVYRPTPVGHFQLTQHFYNYWLTSYDTPGSPDYYPPVEVPNAIQFWNNGYLIHSSPWRKDYGPFTQFPHRDSGGDPEASVGSHGCINVPPAILSDLDAKITNQTPLIIF